MWGVFVVVGESGVYRGECAGVCVSACLSYVSVCGHRERVCVWANACGMCVLVGLRQLLVLPLLYLGKLLAAPGGRVVQGGIVCEKQRCGSVLCACFGGCLFVCVCCVCVEGALSLLLCVCVSISVSFLTRLEGGCLLRGGGGRGALALFVGVSKQGCGSVLCVCVRVFVCEFVCESLVHVGVRVRVRVRVSISFSFLPRLWGGSMCGGVYVCVCVCVCVCLCVYTVRACV
jgi:hypothetical protein